MRVLLTLIVSFVLAYSWEGYSYDKGNYVDVESYDHQGQGEGKLNIMIIALENINQGI